MSKKNIWIILIITVLLSSCNLKLGWETNISTEDWELNIKTNSNNEFSVWTKTIKDSAEKIKNEAKDYIKNKSKFLSDFSTFEKIYEKASKNISESWLKAMETSINYLEKNYKTQIEKNPELKESIVKINNLVEKTKSEFKNWKITKEIKNNFEKIKGDIEKIKGILGK